MKTINPQWLEAVRRSVNPCPYFTLMSLELKELSWEGSRLELLAGDKHLQPFGLVHGGVLAGLVDAAGFWAAYAQLEPGYGMTTAELKLNYLAPVVSGPLVGLGRCLKLGRTLSLAEARVEDGEGRLLAQGLVTLMTLKDLELAGQEGLPRKFLD